MSAAGPDLSGRWTGLFSYPIARPPTTFEAEVRDTGGLITGETSEAGDTPDCLGMILHAVIEGRRTGASVRFTKYYDYLERAPDPIVYEGVVLPGGDEIEGRWTIPGVWSGTFLMIRSGGASASEERRVAERIDT